MHLQDDSSSEYHRHFWLLVLVVAVACLAVLELGVRALGHRPTVNDDASLWAQQREGLSDMEGSHITLVGASRIAYAIDLPLLAQLYPDTRVVQLGIPGGGLLPVVRDVIATPSVGGTYIVSLHPS